MIVQKISKNIFVGKEGEIIVLWGKEKNQTVNVLIDINSSIRQNLHIIEGYYGVEIKEGKEKIILKGEKDKIVEDIKNLQKIVEGLLSVKNLSSQDFYLLFESLKKTQKRFQKSVNQHKRECKEELEGSEKEKTALKVGKATVNLLERIEEIEEITKGILKRTESLLKEKERMETILLISYKRLLKFLGELQKGVTKQRLERIVDEISGGKNNLFNGLMSIKAMPYSKRINSYDIRRLKKLPEYLEKCQEDRIMTTIENAIKKIRPAVKNII